MYDLMIKHGQKFAFGLGAVFTGLFLIFVFGGLGSLGDSPTNEMLYPTSTFDFGIKGTRFLVYVAAFAAIAFEIYYMVTNPKTAIRLGIGLLVLAIIFFIGSAMSSEEVTSAMKQFDVSPALGKRIGGAIWTAIIMAVGAVLLMVISELTAIFK